MNTLEYIVAKWSLDIGPQARMPVEIPNAGRETLADLFRELEFKAGAEIGVKRGDYSAMLCERNPQATIYGVDPYKQYDDYPDVVYQDGFDSWRVDMKVRMAPYPNFRPIKKFSMVAVKQFEPGSLDFVYIDANHTLRYVTEDIVEWAKVVRPGGIVAGHDYSLNKPHGEAPHVQVVEAVNAYVSAYWIRPWFVLGRKSETDPAAIRDRPRSWMFVKP